MKYKHRLYIDIFCAFWGRNFSPKKLQELTNLSLIDANEVGEIKVVICDYGSASLYPPTDYDDSENDVLDWFLETLLKHKKTIIDCGAQEITMWIMYPLEGQQSWALTNQQIKIMADLNVAMCFSAEKRKRKVAKIC